MLKPCFLRVAFRSQERHYKWKCEFKQAFQKIDSSFATACTPRLEAHCHFRPGMPASRFLKAPQSILRSSAKSCRAELQSLIEPLKTPPAAFWNFALLETVRSSSHSVYGAAVLQA